MACRLVPPLSQQRSGERPEAAEGEVVAPGSVEGPWPARMVPWTAAARDAEREGAEEGQEGARWIQQE